MHDGQGQNSVLVMSWSSSRYPLASNHFYFGLRRAVGKTKEPLFSPQSLEIRLFALSGHLTFAVHVVEHLHTS